MTYRKLYSTMLGTIAMGLASCATDINNESESQIDAGTSAKRTLTITTENEPLTRSSVSLINGNKWVKGDKFIAYNLTTPNGFDYIVAIEDGKTMKFEGEVTCKKGDNIALFYPFKQNDYGVTPGNVSVSLDQNTVIENGNPVTGKQDGTIENIKYVDYSWGLAKNISTTDFKGWGTINFRKQYALLLVKFCNDGKPIKNIKSLTISNEPSKGEFNLKTGQYVFPSKIDNPSSYTFTINPSAPLDSFYVAVFPNDNYRPVFTIQTTDGSEYEQALTDGMRIERARYYTITMNMGCTPWVDIDGVKWSRYNLQYTPGDQRTGWVSGYHLAKNPWDYFYTDKCGTSPQGACMPNATQTVKFDHFRWGDIAEAYRYSRAFMCYYWTVRGNIPSMLSSTQNYGDLAYYASRGKWKLPTKGDFDKLMAKTGQYIGYYKDCNNNVIYGILFDPTVNNCLKGWVLSRDNRKLVCSNRDAHGLSYARCYMKQFTKEDICKGVFFPFAGSYTDYIDCTPRLNKPGSQGMYWTACGTNCEQAQAFTGQYMEYQNLFFYGTTKGASAINPKRNMYSIRPILAN
ncbi:fimbrillin family protein [Hoylesella shahii]|uniref:fimbrillin family protein n=1 Tax=Hoylesella shahii TaxID=228603 RepID=UPI0028E4897C|nr:fimbrillin family protein [Hoylesella shahii]